MRVPKRKKPISRTSNTDKRRSCSKMEKVQWCLFPRQQLSNGISRKCVIDHFLDLYVRNLYTHSMMWFVRNVWVSAIGYKPRLFSRQWCSGPTKGTSIRWPQVCFTPYMKRQSAYSNCSPLSITKGVESNSWSNRGSFSLWYLPVFNPTSLVWKTLSEEWLI